MEGYLLNPLIIAPTISPKRPVPAAVAIFSFFKASLATFLPISIPSLIPWFLPAPNALLPIM